MDNINLNPLILNYIEQNHFGRLLGMNFNIQEAGHVLYEMEILPIHLATPLAAHGGVIAALLDATVGVGALSAVCEEGKVVSTVNMNITFFNPTFVQDKLTAQSKILKKGKHLIFMEASIVNQEEKLIATAVATLNSYPKEKAGY